MSTKNDFVATRTLATRAGYSIRNIDGRWFIAHEDCPEEAFNITGLVGYPTKNKAWTAAVRDMRRAAQAK